MSEPRVIAIGDKARLVIGPSDVVVEERKVSKGGVARWDFAGSFGTISAAAMSLVEGRNAGILLPAQIADVGELITAIYIAAATVASALKSAGVPTS